MKTAIEPVPRQGAFLLVGPAGAGKTTMLRERYVDLVRAGEQGILFLVHGRRAARALRDAILRDVGSSTDQVRVTTWHAFALSLLRSHYGALGYQHEPGLLTGPEQFTLVRDMLAAPEEQAHWGEFRRHTRLAGFVEELREFVLRAQDALESPEQLEERARMARRTDLVQAARFFRRYLDVLDDSHLVDHANAIALAVKLLQQDHAIADQVRAEARHLLVDDYQDVTPAQETLLRELFLDGGSVTVAANPDAAVFGFRGGSPSALDDYRKHFAPVHEVALTEVKRPEPHREAWLFDHLTEEADAIARACRRLHTQDGIGWGDIAIVFRRYGPAARAVRRALERRDVPYVVVGENRPLANEPALVPMLELARAALRVEEREERLPKILSSPVGGLDPYDVRALRREARLRDLTLATMIAAPPADLPDRLVAALARVRTLFDEIAAQDQQHDRPDGVFWFLWERLDYFRDMVARGDDAELDAVAAFAKAIERFSDRRPGHRFSDYLRALEGVEFGPEPWNIPEERRPGAVRILTAHQAIGVEFDAVFVAGCVEGEFPDTRDTRAMLDIRDLLAPATPAERTRSRLAEEKRLFGVAVTRARRRLVATCARESSQRQALTPTPYLHLVAADWGAPPPVDEPLTRDEAEAFWRRRLRDATLPDNERLAALDELARLPGVDPDAWWHERDWTDTGRPLITEEWRTSYSRLSPYENCGLQYLFQVELGLDPDQTHHMLVGSWVHDIVDRCAKGELPAEQGALIEELRRLWKPGVFPSPAIEHRARLDSEQMLKRWLESDGRTQPLATEVYFEFPIDGVTLRGYIDRVTRCGSRSVRLTDYKTGAGKSQQDTEEDLQLATYYLAMKRDPNLAQYGEPMYLELAFLARPYARDGFWRPHFDPRRVEGYEQASEARLLELIEGIRNEAFAPKPDANCMWCKFKTLCPVWPEGDEVTL